MDCLLGITQLRVQHAAGAVVLSLRLQRAPAPRVLACKSLRFKTTNQESKGRRRQPVRIPCRAANYELALVLYTDTWIDKYTKVYLHLYLCEYCAASFIPLVCYQQLYWSKCRAWNRHGVREKKPCSVFAAAHLLPQIVLRTVVSVARTIGCTCVPLSAAGVGVNLVVLCCFCFWLVVAGIKVLMPPRSSSFSQPWGFRVLCGFRNPNCRR